uniref:Bm6011 n=1 Tax=Brugia malayi TaxID=6279 RepID=A0A0H5S509_BRUMA|nr:Bm6011 [Brugia malayi]
MFVERSSITAILQTDPPFIQKIKEKLGYKPPPTIENKFSETAGEGYIENDLEDDDLSRINQEDRPQVVILNAQSDLNEKELEAELEKKRAEEDRRKIEEGKIVFKKPVKRKEQHSEEETAGKRKYTEEIKEKCVNEKVPTI